VSYRDLTEFFEKNLHDLKINKALAISIKQYRYRWINKKEDNHLFLGSDLTGVYSPMFTSIDTRQFFTDVIMEDRDHLQQEVYKVKGINKNFEVSSNIFNIITMWIIKNFIEKKMEDAALDMFLIFAYRTFVSLHSRYFMYPVTKAIGMAVVARMSNKYLVKKLGTWNNVFIYRSKDFISTKGVNHRRIMKFKTDDVVKAINDGSGRLKSALLQVYSLTVEVAKQGEQITTKSTTIQDDEGGEIIRDITGGYSSILTDLHAIIIDEHKLVNETYVDVVVKIVGGHIDKTELIRLLKWLSSNFTGTKESKKITEVVDKAITITLNYLNRKGQTSINGSNLYNILTDIKNVWSVRREEDDQQKYKEELISIVKKVSKKKDISVVTSVSVGLITYLFLRASYKN